MSLGVHGAEAGDQRRERRIVAHRRVREGRVDVAEDETGPRDARRQIGQSPPGQWPLLTVVEPEAPEQRCAVDHGQAGGGGCRALALVDLERTLGTTALELEQAQVP